MVNKPFDIKIAQIIVATWPDGQVSLRWIQWLSARGVCIHEQVWGHAYRDIACAYNRAVIEKALPCGKPWVVFADNDIMPTRATDPFLDPNIDADIVACEYPTGEPGTWGEPTRIHTGLWRCRAQEVFGAIPARWFERIYSPDGMDIVECECENFRKKALAAGLTIARAGWADHKLTGA